MEGLTNSYISISYNIMRTGKTVSMYLDDDLIARINDYTLLREQTARYRIPRSIIMRRLIRLGLDQEMKEEEEDKGENEQS